MATETEADPTTEERAKFLFNHTMGLVGYEDAIDTLLGNSLNAPVAANNPDEAAEAVENLEASFVEGVQDAIQNQREHGFTPIRAFEDTVDEEWPEWAQRRIADSEYAIFAAGMSEPTDEEQEYLDRLEERYDVPR